MIPDEQGKQLHDRCTRGESLTAEEQRQLDDWYSAQDRAELDALSRVTGTPDLSELQSQVNRALTQLAATVEHVKALSEENEILRQEINRIRQQIAQKKIA